MLDRFLPKGWAHRTAFYEDLSSSIYIPYPQDVAAVRQVCQSAFECSLEDKLHAHSEWVWARVRRQIPNPSYLCSSLETFWEKWGNVPDENGTAPLFGEEAEQVFKSMLAMVDGDLVSDPPSAVLYRVLKTDGHGLTVYSCQRWPRGEVEAYRKINEVMLREKNCSVELADCIATSTMAMEARKEDVRRGRVKDYGHYDSQLIDSVNELHFELFGQYDDPNYVPTRSRPTYY